MEGLFLTKEDLVTFEKYLNDEVITKFGMPIITFLQNIRIRNENEEKIKQEEVRQEEVIVEEPQAKEFKPLKQIP